MRKMEALPFWIRMQWLGGLLDALLFAGIGLDHLRIFALPLVFELLVDLFVGQICLDLNWLNRFYIPCTRLGCIFSTFGFPVSFTR